MSVIFEHTVYFVMTVAIEVCGKIIMHARKVCKKKMDTEVTGALSVETQYTSHTET